MNEILCGDALDTLKTLESGSVQTCVTSPPEYIELINARIAAVQPDLWEATA